MSEITYEMEEEFFDLAQAMSNIHRVVCSDCDKPLTVPNAEWTLTLNRYATQYPGAHVDDDTGEVLPLFALRGFEVLFHCVECKPVAKVTE